MGTKKEMASLANLADGAAIEAVDYQLRRVLENCIDPNTSDKSRSVTLKVTIRPGKKNRNICDVAFDVKASYAPMKTFESVLLVGKNEQGLIEAREIGETMEIPFPEEQGAGGPSEASGDAEAEGKTRKIRELYSKGRQGGGE
jgi:hypothetical protein